MMDSMEYIVSFLEFDPVAKYAPSGEKAAALIGSSSFPVNISTRLSIAYCLVISGLRRASISWSRLAPLFCCRIPYRSLLWTGERSPCRYG